MKKYQIATEGEEHGREEDGIPEKPADGDRKQMERLMQFDRESVPPRVVFAKGAGAFGYFQCHQSMEPYTTADFLRSERQITKVFVRFSHFMGTQGSADTDRDIRGFEVRFYTREGNFDLAGCHLPVFFVSDAKKFVELVHALKPAPGHHVREKERFWEFVSWTPDVMHLITWLYTDRGTVRDYRHMDGYGVNTYLWMNQKKERCYVRYHFMTMQGIQETGRVEAQRMAGSDPDIAARRLYQAIEEGRFPRYELFVQRMQEEDLDKVTFDPLDDTNLWPRQMFPFHKVGVMTLNENPADYLTEVEQSAFSPGNLVPGIGLSADPMLKDRPFCCLDAQRYRIGTHFRNLPVNHSGVVTRTELLSAKVFPGGTPAFAPDHYTQAGMHYRSLCQHERETLHDNIAVELAKCRMDVIRRVLYHMEEVDKQFARGVSRAMEKYC